MKRDAETGPEYQRGFADGYAAALKANKPDPLAVHGLNQEAWADWTQYRKRIGKRPYKTQAAAKWLAQYPSQEQAKIVARSLQNEWQGLFPLPAGEQSKPGDAPEQLL